MALAGRSWLIKAPRAVRASSDSRRPIWLIASLPLELSTEASSPTDALAATEAPSTDLARTAPTGAAEDLAAGRGTGLAHSILFSLALKMALRGSREVIRCTMPANSVVRTAEWLQSSARQTLGES
jgi:hypothetical protein